MNRGEVLWVEGHEELRLWDKMSMKLVAKSPHPSVANCNTIKKNKTQTSHHAGIKERLCGLGHCSSMD